LLARGSPSLALPGPAVPTKPRPPPEHEFLQHLGRTRGRVHMPRGVSRAALPHDLHEAVVPCPGHPLVIPASSRDPRSARSTPAWIAAQGRNDKPSLPRPPPVIPASTPDPRSAPSTPAWRPAQHT